MTPLTQFEIDGRWSSTQFSDNLTQQIADETDAVVEILGQSFEGKNIYSVTLGEGDRVLFISGGVHRNEYAAHEVVLMKMRDMAYNVNDEYTDFLLEHKVIFVPTVQPDRETSRENAQNLNINRDAYRLETPEMPILMKKITESNPDVYIDFHERLGDRDRVEFIDAAAIDANSHISIRQSNADLVSYIRSGLVSEGYTTQMYPQHWVGPGKTVSAAMLIGAVTMTPETHWNASSPEFRINALKRVFDYVLDWHKNNHSEIINYKELFSDSHLKAGDYFTLYNNDNEFYADADAEIIRLPERYLLENASDFSLWAETYGVEVDGEGFVSVNQKAGRLLPHLLDPRSDMKVVAATRVEPEEPEKRTDGRYTKVLMDEWREVFIKGFYA